MFAFKLVVATLFCVMALFVCRVVIKLVSKALQTGQWQARTGVADRSISPKTFWLCLTYPTGLALLGVAAAIFLMVAALTSK